MTKQQHPITPPEQLLEVWWCRHIDEEESFDVLLTEAYQAGADLELEACCKLFESNSVCGTKFQRRSSVRDLRDKRRPKPPSLKEQAKFAAAVLRSPDETCSIGELQQHWYTICNALEALPND
jgi:hypothetical protein